MRILVTGGSGVLGRVLLPLLQADGHDVTAPGHSQLDLYDANAVKATLNGVEAVYHLATRIPPPARAADPAAWDENDRLRSVATRLLVDAGLETGASTFVLPSVTFLYPRQAHVDEDTRITEAPGRLQSMIDAETEVKRFAAGGRHGVILRLGLLWGPGTGNDTPAGRYGSTLHVEDAGEALRLALRAPGALYNIVADGEFVSNARFKLATAWQPRFQSPPSTL